MGCEVLVAPVRDIDNTAVEAPDSTREQVVVAAGQRGPRASTLQEARKHSG